MEQIWIVYALINVIVFSIYGIDKVKAIRNSYRIPEKILILLGILGSFGALFGMLAFRHKIRKIKFTIIIPLFVIIHSILILYIKFRS